MAERPKRRRGARWLRIRTLAFERDRAANAGCWICELEGRDPTIDYSLPISSSPRSYEADHYIPVDDRPDLEYDLGNLRASHKSCNRSRGKRAGTKALGEPSRDWRRRG